MSEPLSYKGLLPEQDYGFEIDVYDAYIHVYQNIEELLLLFELLEDAEMARVLRRSQACAISMNDPRGQQWLLLYLPADADGPTVAHEALHLGFMVLEARGVPITMDEHEALAYLVEHIVREIEHERALLNRT